MDSQLVASYPLGWLYPLLMSWQVPVYTASAYFVTFKVLLRPHSTTKQKNQKDAGASKLPTKKGDSLLFKSLVYIHNILLCAFSAMTFFGMAPILLRNLAGRPTVEALCDRDSKMWKEGLLYYSWLFYLSKYYEIFDTVILVLKGKQPSLLQSYHHAGAIISMWLGVRGRATAIWIFVVFNSFIHTLMYAYYAASMMISVPRIFKQTLTRMQIGQFIIGGMLAISYCFLPNCFKHFDATDGSQSPSMLAPGVGTGIPRNGSDLSWEETQQSLWVYERWAYAVNVLYLVPLTYLFVGFFRRSYGRVSMTIERKES